MGSNLNKMGMTSAKQYLKRTQTHDAGELLGQLTQNDIVMSTPYYN